MKIFVAGLWHLGCVTATCFAKAGHQVAAYDPNLEVLTQLSNGKAPIFEPGLDDLLCAGQKAGRLKFVSELSEIKNSEILWVAFDTPVDENDIADIVWVSQQIEALFPYLPTNILIIIASQVPVGTTRQLQQKCAMQFPDKKIIFSYVPENLRLGKAIAAFTNADRFVVGFQNEKDKVLIGELLKSFTNNIIWMSIESAEMTKHALNAFLATSVTFINELATLCEHVGANAREVEVGLKSEERIGFKAYLRPGNAIGGGTLARDVNYLIQIKKQKN